MLTGAPAPQSALAPYAMDVTQSRGRRHSEAAHPYRNDYARDRDRVIHSRAFRRLEAKTQVFTRRYSDHFRNRLTHTIEVSQIARTVAGALRLNADLAEALALVHDIGHPPFGHAGEQKLDALLRPFGDRFDHNLHALNIVERFEQRYIAFPGLNLTFEVREGIVKHSRDYSAADYPELAEYLLDQRPPLEAQLIDLVDEIAYNTADLDDGVEAGLLTLDQILAGHALFARFYGDIDRRYPQARAQLKFNEANKRVLNLLATDLIDSTRARVAASGAMSVEDVRLAVSDTGQLPAHRLAGFSEAIARQNREIKSFLLANLYNHPVLVDERERSVEALEQLFHHYMNHPQAMPPFYAEEAVQRPKQLVVCDYIAGMTDDFLLRAHRDLIGK
jgi:dGTPase